MFEYGISMFRETWTPFNFPNAQIMLAEGGLSSFMGPSATQGLGEPSLGWDFPEIFFRGQVAHFPSFSSLLPLHWKNSYYLYHFMLDYKKIIWSCSAVSQNSVKFSCPISLLHQGSGCSHGSITDASEITSSLRLEIQLPTLRQRPPEERSQLCGALLGLWSSCSPSLGLSVLFCKMGGGEVGAEWVPRPPPILTARFWE